MLLLLKFTKKTTKPLGRLDGVETYWNTLIWFKYFPLINLRLAIRYKIKIQIELNSHSYMIYLLNLKEKKNNQCLHVWYQMLLRDQFQINANWTSILILYFSQYFSNIIKTYRVDYFKFGAQFVSNTALVCCIGLARLGKDF